MGLKSQPQNLTALMGLKSQPQNRSYGSQKPTSKLLLWVSKANLKTGNLNLTSLHSNGSAGMSLRVPSAWAYALIKSAGTRQFVSVNEEVSSLYRDQTTFVLPSSFNQERRLAIEYPIQYVQKRTSIDFRSSAGE